MSSYKDLEIYKIAYELAKKVHYASLKLPSFELHEQGSQVRRSSKSVKDQIEMIIDLYPDLKDFTGLLPEYEILGKKINMFIQYVEISWKR